MDRALRGGRGHDPARVRRPSRHRAADRVLALDARSRGRRPRRLPRARRGLRGLQSPRTRLPHRTDQALRGPRRRRLPPDVASLPGRELPEEPRPRRARRGARGREALPALAARARVGARAGRRHRADPGHEAGRVSRGGRRRARGAAHARRPRPNRRRHAAGRGRGPPLPRSDDARRRPLTAVPTSSWAPLRRPLFRSLWLAAVASNVGTWMQNVGAVWLMTSLTPSPLMVALVQTATSLPVFLLALPAGALADIVDRRRLLVAAQSAMLLAAAALGVLTVAGRVTPWALLGLTFVIGAGSAMNGPGWQAIMPELVPRPELTAAIALNGIAMNVARAIGPALGGLVIAVAGTGPVFLLNAASFVGVILVLLRWRRVPRASTLPPERVVGAMRAGLRYARHAPPLRAVLVRAG